MMPINSRLRRALVNLGLRTFPFVPAREVKELFDALTKEELAIEQQVEEAVLSLQKSSSLVTTLETSLKEKTERLEKLQAEYKKYTELTTLTRDQAEAVTNLLERTIDRDKWAERVIALGMHLGTGILFMILGVILADRIQQVWHSYWSNPSATMSAATQPAKEERKPTQTIGRHRRCCNAKFGSYLGIILSPYWTGVWEY